MAKLRILRDYNRLNDAQLGDFALHNATKLTGNTNFTTPPLNAHSIDGQPQARSPPSIAACVNGTPQDTVHKNVLRTQLVAQLDQLADYVELTALGTSGKMLSSAITRLPAPARSRSWARRAILKVTNLASTKLRWR
jgi:hypothetical protein